jgi:taurine--2-oxoglutarate transaminase
MPLGVAIARKAIGDKFKEQFFSHGATYMGHTLSCATAVRVIQIYQEDELIENSEKTGKYLLEKSLELKEKHPCVGDVRGLGLFVGFELVKNKKTKEPIMPVAAKIQPGINPKLKVSMKAVSLGVLVGGANPSNVIVVAPPLFVRKDEIDEGIKALDQALEEGDAFAEK